MSTPGWECFSVHIVLCGLCAILHLDRPVRFAQRVWLRQKRVLRAFLANHKCSLPTTTAASINRPVSPKLKTQLVALIRPE